MRRLSENVMGRRGWLRIIYQRGIINFTPEGRQPEQVTDERDGWAEGRLPKAAAGEADPDERGLRAGRVGRDGEGRTGALHARPVRDRPRRRGGEDGEGPGGHQTRRESHPPQAVSALPARRAAS